MTKWSYISALLENSGFGSHRLNAKPDQNAVLSTCDKADDYISNLLCQKDIMIRYI